MSGHEEETVIAGVRRTDGWLEIYEEPRQPLAEPPQFIAERQKRVRARNGWTREDKLFWGGLAAFFLLEIAIFLGAAYALSHYFPGGLKP
jgi:hypothetical protein